MESWTAIGGLAFAVVSWVVASAVRHGKLQQHVVVLEREVSTLQTWRQTLGQPIAQVGQLHEDITSLVRQLSGINTTLADLRVVIGRMEGYQEAQRERSALQRRDTIPPV